MPRRGYALIGVSLLGLAAVAALAAVAKPATAPPTELFGTVGPGLTITLRDAQGRAVTRVPPGEYRIRVEDRSDFHNFRLVGPGVSEMTDVEAIETVVWSVTLVEGTYRFFCVPHESDMSGRFTVGTGPPPPPLRRMVATVGPRNTISLTFNGRRATRVPAGPYAITVRDRSRTHNFHLIGPGVNRKTTLRAVGTFTWRVTLRTGTYRYQSDRHLRTLRRTFRAVSQ